MLHLNMFKNMVQIGLFFFNPLILVPFSSSKDKQIPHFLSLLAVITETQKDDDGELL